MCKEERRKSRVRITSLRLPQKIIPVNINGTPTHIQLARTQSCEYNLIAMQTVKSSLPLGLEEELYSRHCVILVKSNQRMHIQTAVRNHFLSSDCQELESDNMKVNGNRIHQRSLVYICTNSGGESQSGRCTWIYMYSRTQHSTFYSWAHACNNVHTDAHGDLYRDVLCRVMDENHGNQKLHQ